MGWQNAITKTTHIPAAVKLIHCLPYKKALLLHPQLAYKQIGPILLIGQSDAWHSNSGRACTNTMIMSINCLNSCS